MLPPPSEFLWQYVTSTPLAGPVGEIAGACISDGEGTGSRRGGEELSESLPTQEEEIVNSQRGTDFAQSVGSIESPNSRRLGLIPRCSVQELMGGPSARTSRSSFPFQSFNFPQSTRRS